MVPFKRFVGWFCLSIVCLLLLFLAGTLVSFLWEVIPAGGKAVLGLGATGAALAFGMLWGFGFLDEKEL